MVPGAWRFDPGGGVVPVEQWSYKDGVFQVSGRTSFEPRSALVPGDYMPGPGTTGILTEKGSLTVHDGNLTTTVPGQVIENLWIKGKLTRKHAGVVVRNCYIDGSTASESQTSYASVTAYDATGGEPMRMYDCTIRGDVPFVWSGNGFQGADAELHRCDVAGGTDGLNFQNGNVKAISTWVHDLAWYAEDFTHVDGTHNDGLQIHGGRDYQVLGCRFDIGYKGTSAILSTTQSGVGGTIGDVEISKSWFFSTWPSQANACAIALNIIDDGTGQTGWSVTDCVFSAPGTWRINGPGSTRVGLCSAGTKALLTWTGNVDTNGVPVTLGTG